MWTVNRSNQRRALQGHRDDHSILALLFKNFVNDCLMDEEHGFGVPFRLKILS